MLAPVPFTPFLPPGLYFPLSRSYFLSSSLSLSLFPFSHFTSTSSFSAALPSERHGRFHRRVSIFLTRWSLARCRYSLCSVFSIHKYTNAESLAISELRFFYFRFASNCINLDCTYISSFICYLRFSYFRIDLIQLEEFIGNCISFNFSLYLLLYTSIIYDGQEKHRKNLFKLY